MSIIKIPLLFARSESDKKSYTFFGTGATFSCIAPANAELIGNIEKLYMPLEVGTDSSGHYLKIEHPIRVDSHFIIYGLVPNSCSLPT